MRKFDTEIATITGITSVVASALALVNSISSRVQAAIDAFKADNPEADTTELDAALADANDNAQALAAAVAANTPGGAGVTIPPGSGEESTGAVAQQPSNGGAEDQTHGDPAPQPATDPAPEADPEPQA